jgi:hypothetical protein
LSNKCAFCYEADVLHPTPGHVAACEACLAEGLCYFCRQAPAIHSEPNPRTLVRYPTCKSCWDEQLRLSVHAQGVKFVGLAIVALVILGIIFAIKSC